MEFKSKRKPFLDYVYIIVGTTFLAISINLFLDPLELVTGGVTGIAIIVKALTQDMVNGGMPLWLTNLIINLPLFVAAVLIKGKNFGLRTLFSTIYLSFALYYTQWFPAVTYDLFLGSIVGGVLSGIGLGLVFLAFATTGGTDLMASLMHHFIKHHSIAKIMFVLDGIIIAGGMVMFGIEKSLYAIICIFIATKVIDAILDGFHYSKAAFIISDHNEWIAADIMQGLDRGVTGLNGEGMYTKMNKNVLLCVVSKKEIIKVKEIVKKRDFRAFVIVADVREVLGEGFKEYNDV